MSTNDDTRVLNMRINNKEFLRGTSDSLKAIDTLNKGIDGAGKGKGMQSLGGSVDTVKTKFGALQIAGVTALATITNKAVNSGLNLIKSFSIGPIIDGYREYEKLLKSTQTIMGNTGDSAKTVGHYLDALNGYSDQTIYNFGQMADSIGKFTAAGGKGSLGKSVDAIKGLANSAALAGSDVNQLNTAMYQMSQAMASGSVKLMDWNSLVNAGMGGKNMQYAFKEAAKSIDGMGSKMESSIKKAGNFRESLKSGWLSSEVFSKAMKVMGGQALNATSSMKSLESLGLQPVTREAIRAGKVFQFLPKDIQALKKRGFDEGAIGALQMGQSVAYTTEQLQKMGYSKKAAEELSKLGKNAIDSATKVKTFTQLIDVLKEAVGSGWAGIFRQLFGNIDEAGKVWTKVNDVVGGAIQKMFYGINLMLQSWHDMKDAASGLNGFQMLWAGIGNIFKSVGNLLKPLLVLIQGILPSSEDAGSGLFNVTKAFYNFSVMLEKVTSNASIFNPVMNALAWVFRLIFTIVGAVIKSFFNLIGLFKPIAEAVGGLVDALGGLGAKVTGIESLGNGVEGLFQGFLKLRELALTPIIDTLADIINAFTTLVNGDVSGFKKQFVDAFSNLSGIKDFFVEGKEMGQDIIDGLKSSFSGGSINDKISGFVDSFVNFFKGLLGIHSPSTVFAEIGNNIVQGLINGIVGAVGLVIDVVKGVATGIMDELGVDKFDLANIFSVVFGGGVLLIVTRFMKSITNIVHTFEDLGDSIKAPFDQSTKAIKTFQNGIRAKALLNIALAVGVLAAALWVIAKIPAEKLAVGLGAITVLLTELTFLMSKMAKNAAKTKTGVASMVAMSGAMTALSIAVLALSAAVLAFGMMPTDVLIKGGIAVAVALAALAGAAYLLGKAGPWMAAASLGVLMLSAALGVLAVSLTLMAGTIALYNKMDWSTILDGLAKMAVLLLGLTVSMALLSVMSPGLLIASAALIALSIGLTMMAGVLSLFDKMSWGTIGGGIAKLSVALIALGIAGQIAAPGLILLGVAAVALGAGLMLIGTGLALAGIGLTAITVAGVAAGAVLITALEGFISLLPMIGVQLVAALTSILAAIAQKAPKIIDSLVKIIREVLRGIRELIPDVVRTAVDLVVGFVHGLALSSGDLVAAGIDIVLNLLTGIGSRIGEFTQRGIDILVGFLEGITNDNQMQRIVDAGVALIVSFLDGIGGNADNLATAAFELILDLLTAINDAVETYTEPIVETGRSIGLNLIEGIVLGLVPDQIETAFRALVDRVVGFFKGLLGINSPSTVFAGFGRNIVEGLISGITSLAGSVGGAIGTLVSNIVSAISSLPGKFKGALSGFAGTVRGVFTGAFDAGRTAVTAGVSAIGSAVGKIAGTVGGAVSSAGEKARGLGSAIVKGIGKGLGAAVNAVGNLGSALIRGIKDAINSALKLPFNIPKFSIKLGPKSFSVGGQQLIPRFAKGVTGFGGGSALVGEVGPELVTMGRGANVITNENLVNFMKQVGKLTKAMSSRNESQKFSGGNIQYVVSADFRGDPKASGIAFAGNLAAGLIQGLKRTQTPVNDAVSGMGSKMAGAFASTLGIHSPSTVFEQYAKYVGEGFILGLLSTTNAVSAAGLIMAKSATDIVSKTITDAQLQYEAMKAEADAYAAAAKNTKLSKSERKKMSDAAKKAAAAAEKQKEIADKANAEADRKAQFEAADASGKASMRNEDALTQAQLASDLRTEAIKLTKEADLIAKRDKKKAAELDALAQKQLEAAQAAANLAETYAKEASDFAAQGRSGMTIGQQILSVTAEDVAKAQAAFEAYVKSYTDAQTSAKEENSQPKEITFQQINNSPEAISPADAYRNGKSLVSLAEKKLAPTG